MREYDIRLSQFNITPWRQRELVAYFRQYPELKKELIKMALIASPELSDSPHTSASRNPTEKCAIRRLYLLEKIENIDKAIQAIEDKDYHEIIRQNLCYKRGLRSLQCKFPWLNCSGFYRCRRRAIVNLDYILTQKNSP